MLYIASIEQLELIKRNGERIEILSQQNSILMRDNVRQAALIDAAHLTNDRQNERLHIVEAQLERLAPNVRANTEGISRVGGFVSPNPPVVVRRPRVTGAT